MLHPLVSSHLVSSLLCSPSCSLSGPSEMQIFLCDSASRNPLCGSSWFRIKPDPFLWLLGHWRACLGTPPCSHSGPLPHMACVPATAPPRLLKALHAACSLLPCSSLTKTSTIPSMPLLGGLPSSARETVLLLCAPIAPTRLLSCLLVSIY